MKVNATVEFSTFFIAQSLKYQSLPRKIHFTASNLASKDYYKTLGVSKNSSQKEIKKAYYQVFIKIVGINEVASFNKDIKPAVLNGYIKVFKFK